jgi:ketosteroid isomerase-like protein
MKRLWVTGAVALVLLLAGGVAAHRANSDSAQDALLKADRDFNDATAARGPDGFASFLADNVGTLRADKPVIVGKASLVEIWRPLLESSTVAIRWTPISASASSGDLGYTVGMYEITQKDEKGKHTVGTGKYVTIWRKQSDGNWKVEFDTGVADSEPAGEKPRN